MTDQKKLRPEFRDFLRTVFAQLLITLLVALAFAAFKNLNK